MRRKRQQKGTLFKKCGFWYLRYSDFRVTDGKLERKRLAKPLASIDDATKKKARELADEFLATINKPKLRPETAVQLVEFVETNYLPSIKTKKKPSTVHGYGILWGQVKPFCGTLLLRDVLTVDIQNILDAAAQALNEEEKIRYTRTTLQHMKHFLGGVFSFASQKGYYHGVNPVHEAKAEGGRERSETYAYSLEEVFLMLDAVADPSARTMLATAAFTGVRRGELRGMRWQDYGDIELDDGRKCKAIQIAQSIWNGIATTPKTDKSASHVPVIAPLAKMLAEHRKLGGNPISGPIFPNGSGNAADPDSVLRRKILPALAVCEACSKVKAEHTAKTDHEYKRNTRLPIWRGWHAFRRGLATNLNRLGVNDKVVQVVLRHANVSTTQDCYIKPISADAQNAMEKFEVALTDTNLTPKAPKLLQM